MRPNKIRCVIGGDCAKRDVRRQPGAPRRRRRRFGRVVGGRLAVGGQLGWLVIFARRRGGAGGRHAGAGGLGVSRLAIPEWSGAPIPRRAVRESIVSSSVVTASRRSSERGGGVFVERRRSSATRPERGSPATVDTRRAAVILRR